MYPPIFSIASSDATVRSIFGISPVRFYTAGEAPENCTVPYAVWQTVTGSPENYVSNTPDIDMYLIQVDVYGTTVTSVRNGAEALRDALEPHAHIVSWRGESTDQGTGHKRYSFDINFITPR